MWFLGGAGEKKWEARNTLLQKFSTARKLFNDPATLQPLNGLSFTKCMFYGS